MTQATGEEIAKFEIDIEGALKPWFKDTITTEEIAGFGRVGSIGGGDLG